MHLTGGIGAPQRQAFGDNYELPNETAYLETCAAIANALWNQRMFLLHGDAKYIDDLGTRDLQRFPLRHLNQRRQFFYPNPLASRGGYARSKWFGCSCCPVNVVRFIPQIASFTYAQRDETVYVNLFVASQAALKTPVGTVTLIQTTDYPWNGHVRIEVKPDKERLTFPLNIRIPGWAIGTPVPSDLYVQTEPGSLKDISLQSTGSRCRSRLIAGI